MKRLNRRSFLQSAALAGASVAIPVTANASTSPAILGNKPKSKINLGFIGVGLRGQSHVELALMRDDCNVLAIADPQAVMVNSCLKMFDDKGVKRPKVFSNGDYDYLELLKEKDINAVVISSPWEWHTQQAVAAMVLPNNLVIKSEAYYHFMREYFDYYGDTTLTSPTDGIRQGIHIVKTTNVYKSFRCRARSRL